MITSEGRYVCKRTGGDAAIPYKQSVPCTVKLQIRHKPEASGSGAEMRLSRPEDSRGLMSEGSRLDFEKESL